MISEIPDALQIQDFLRSHFAKPPPGFVSRLLGESPEYTYKLHSIERLGVSDFLTQSVVYRVVAEEQFLENVRIPAVAGSTGVFASINSEIAHLSPVGAEQVWRILQREATVARIPAAVAADFIGEVGLPNYTTHYKILDSSTVIQQMARQGTVGGGYLVDKSEFERCSDLIEPPHLHTEKDGAITITFFALVGPLFDKRKLEIIQFEGGPNNIATISKTTVSERVFTSVPRVMT